VLATVNTVGTSDLRTAQGEILAGRYRTIRRLAGGASGRVFLVEDKTQGTRAVLKVLPMHAAARDVRAEFARLADLAHPNIVRVRDAGILSDGAGPQRAFMVTDYVAGRPLAELLAARDERSRLDTFATAADHLADALAYLHGQGVVHGDISPANVRCNDAGQPVLIDFGLSLGPETPTASPRVSGTLGFISPEALLGERGPTGDLFALGAVLYHAWTGTAPFGVGMVAVRRAWQGPPPAPSALRPGLPEAWDGLLLRMLATNVEGRPASAREILQEMRTATPGRSVLVEGDLAVPYPAGDPLAGLVVGRADEEACLRGHIESLADGAADVSVVWVVGAVGSGRHTLVRRALRDARLAMLTETMPAFDIEEGECVDLLHRDKGEGAPGDPLAAVEPLGRSQAEIAGLIATLEARAGQRPLCVALAGSIEDQALAAAVAHGPPSGRLLLLLPCERPWLHSGCAVIELPGLSRESIAELARRGAGTEPPAEVVDRVAAASGGLAGAVAILVRAWITKVREGRTTAFELGDSAQDLTTLLDRGFASLAPSTRAFLVAVALDASGHDEVSGDDERAARSAGWLLPESHELPSALHASALWRAVSDDGSLQDVARRASAGLAARDARLAEVQWALGERELAAASFWAAMRAAHAKDAWGRVVELGLRAVEARPDTGTCEDRLALAGALGILGRYDDALRILDGCPGGGEPDQAMRVIERKAWLLGRQGKPNHAVVIVEAALAGMPPLADATLLLRARLARLLVARGQFADAITAAAPAVRTNSAAAAPAREAMVLALAYAGRLREAREMVDDLARPGGEPLVAARIASLDGLVHQLAGQPSPAAEAYQLAVAGYEQLRDLHGAAAATFNLGCVLAEVGNYAAAIEALERAIRDLGRLRALTDHALAVFNVGQLFLQLGDLDAASRCIARLAEDASDAGVEAFRGYTLLLGAELARKRRTLPESAASYLEAAEFLAGMGMQPMADVAVLARAETLAELGDLGEAKDAVAKVEARIPAEERRSDASVGEAAMMARARVALRDTGSVDVVGLAEALAAACERAQEARRLPAAWRIASLAFQLLARAGDARQAHYKELAKTLFREVAMKTPAKYWPAMQAEPEARVLDLRSDGPQAGPETAARVALLEGRLRRLSRINKRLNSDLRLSRVLETIIDTVIELTDAERGFLLLKDGTGELAVKVARNIDQTSLEGPALSLSRSIAKQAAETGQPVVTVDAAGDSRFAELLSVSDLHLRSVLAVPLSVKGTVVGTIYVDHRLRKGVFREDELALLLDFAEQGAIAIENARVVSELRRRERQVQSLNRQLEQELRIKEATLDDVRVELKESRQVAALRYDYREIVGQSPVMLEMFRLLDRVTDTHLPIVVEGESGTGKELVARAIHFHGPRKERAFVSENCAAIPETLLESTLFGHVRGAFTGADRDSRGLFAVANGGTLFLDEVAEMSPAMQGKLLRVLQDGEYHRVGGERAEKVDVRIVVATNKNLAQLVEEGRFRKDLFYRLGAVRIRLPPLRERQEDIPLLLRHFLDKAAQLPSGVPKGIDSAAVEKLCGYPWPGNVRELENEIARAGVFAGDRISVSDLSPHIQAGQEPLDTVRTDPDNLRLRQRVERLERQMIREAMGRSLGNQTKAAALLGLSRFGLQKKLRRYNLTG
jgi:transcriptional regulator with GAF, ATPase, and Fis domain/tetratricopeptide (TPR) repeat protein